MQEVLQHVALQSAMEHRTGEALYSEVVSLGIDELACRPGLPHHILQSAQHVLSVVGVVSGEHAACLGMISFRCLRFSMHEYVSAWESAISCASATAAGNSCGVHLDPASSVPQHCKTMIRRSSYTSQGSVQLTEASCIGVAPV